MKISYNWLKEFIDIKESPEELGKLLTSAGLEVESIEPYDTIKGGLQGVVIGEVLTKEKHPNADSLSLTTVDVGGATPLPIVCGAKNVAAGQKVVVATVGATLYPVGGEAFTIKKAKIRGEQSEGMICAEDEIGLGTSHEGIMVLDTTLPNGTPAAQYFGVSTDYVFEIGLTPNRADAASHYGVVRDLKVLLNRATCLHNVSTFAPKNNNFPIKVVVENTQACPRYAGVSLTGVKVAPSPKWLQDRLKAIGLSPINNIVDITNYVLHEVGQPLHAFDADKLANRTIVVKTLPEGTPFKTLDNVERKLVGNDLMICDGNSTPLCIGGVFGGIESGISEQTVNIFLESAYFSPEYIRRTSQHHGLKTDASFRFERGTNPDMVLHALKRAALLITEIAGGEIASEITDNYPQRIQPFSFFVKYKNINRLIGKEMDKHFVKRTLKSLEITIQNEQEDGLLIAVPPYRVDVQREADIVEELLRLYGYDNVELSAHLATSFLANFPTTDRNQWRFQISDLLAANGFYEIQTNSLTNPSYAEALGKGDTNVEMLNPLSQELSVMRQSLVHSGLEVIAHNINRRQKDLRLFEFGKTYHKITKEDGNSYHENLQLALYLSGSQVPETWQRKTQKATFFTLKGFVTKVLQKLGLDNLQITEIGNGGDGYNEKVFAYGLAVSWRKKEVARFGLLKPNFAKQLDVKQEVFYAEIEWESIIKQLNQKYQYAEIAKFPEVRRDLSLVLDKKVTFAEIQALAHQAEKKLLQKVNVFDVYEGENIGADKKSYSVSFILQDAEQTLTDTAIDKVMEKLMKVYEEKLGAVIRK